MKRFPHVALLATALSLSWSLAGASAAPPVVEAPAQVKGKPGAFIVVTVKTDAKNAQFVSLTPGINIFPPGLLNDPKTTVVTAAEEGIYTLLIYSGNADGGSDPVYTEVVVTKTGTLPPPKKPTEPPIDPPPTPATSLYFLIVGADGPVNPAVTKALSLPEWKILTKAGHSFKYKTLTESVELGVRIPFGTTSGPVVVILRPRADGKTSEQLGVVALPTTGAGVLALPTQFK